MASLQAEERTQQQAPGAAGAAAAQPLHNGRCPGSSRCPELQPQRAGVGAQAFAPPSEGQSGTPWPYHRELSQRDENLLHLLGLLETAVVRGILISGGATYSCFIDRVVAHWMSAQV